MKKSFFFFANSSLSITYIFILKLLSSKNGVSYSTGLTFFYIYFIQSKGGQEIMGGKI